MWTGVALWHRFPDRVEYGVVKIHVLSNALDLGDDIGASFQSERIQRQNIGQIHGCIPGKM